MKIRTIAATTLALAIGVTTLLGAPAQAGDVQLLRFPAPRSLGMSGSWSSYAQRECGATPNLIKPCINQSWFSGEAANATWRIWDGQAIRTRTAAQRKRLVAGSLTSTGSFHFTSKTSSSSHGIATYTMSGSYYPFGAYPPGRGRKVVSVYGNRIVELFYGYGNSATQKGVPSMATILQIVRDLILPSDGVIPLARSIVPTT